MEHILKEIISRNVLIRVWGSPTTKPKQTQENPDDSWLLSTPYKTYISS